ncbi:hypothetical protein A2310_08890 [candidate division WOR-1 bacterium RIFOXYB2_FULL_37_13]|uniref:DUF2442 domain-containing protein n=1 Tax=candidate division WOR-1 bacterium RIFOXYB2_FULL_37_13 TaxID=1802579 RepID=A0A1F4SGZ2_UNCSA|nr:MAG: hypothetical protein A2310_08890 [candidate division WOR-1 bacterium RIFOXYB2_FULL_37_13]
MHNIIKAECLQPYKIRIRFSDNIEGVVDLSDLAGKGVFKFWNDPENFKAVKIDPQTNTIMWDNGNIDLCPDSLYEEVTTGRMKQ